MVAGWVAPKYKFVVLKFHCRYVIRILLRNLRKYTMLL